MLRNFTPNAYYENIKLIELQKLQALGIKGLIFDLDNTITTWNNLDIDDPEVVNWFGNLKNYGIKACILSNNKSLRIKPVADKLGIYFVESAKKPLLVGYKRALKVLGSDSENTIMIGDQLFTDIWGAKRLGMRGILVKPIALGNEFWGTRINRFLERRIIKSVHKRIPKDL